MNIAILAPEFIPACGGAGIYTVELVKELLKNKEIEIHVITPQRGNLKDIKEDFGEKLKIHYISNANDSFFFNFKFQIAILKKFSVLHEKYNFDIVHSTGLVQMPDIFLKFKKLKIPSLVTVHTTIDTQFDYKAGIDYLRSMEPVELLSKLAYPGIKLLQTKYISSTDNYICVSKYVTTYIPKKKNIRIINNGIDTNRFKPQKNSEFSYLDKINMPKVLYSGRLLYMKGIDILISAIKKIVKKQEVHFIFAGSGDIKKWKSKLTDVPLKNYSFLGQVDHAKISSLYQKADIFVLPSFVESFPYSILEAMSSSLPVIATKVGGVPELIQHNKNGLLIPSQNSLELKKSIEYLLENKSKRETLGRNARLTVKKHYSIKKMAESTKEFYKDIIGDYYR